MHTPQKLILVMAAMVLAVTASASSSRQNQNAAPASSAASSSQSPSPATSAKLGSIAGNVYTNDSLGMTYEFPKGWFVDQAWMDMANRPQDPGPRPTDPEEQAKYDSMVAMMKGTHALISVSEQSAASPKVSGPRIQLTVSPVFENRSGADILNLSLIHI